MTVGVASQPAADAERYRYVCVYTAHMGWLGVVMGYQCGLDWGRSSTTIKYLAHF